MWIKNVDGTPWLKGYIHHQTSYEKLFHELIPRDWLLDGAWQLNDVYTMEQDHLDARILMAIINLLNGVHGCEDGFTPVYLPCNANNEAATVF